MNEESTRWMGRGLTYGIVSCIMPFISGFLVVMIYFRRADAFRDHRDLMLLALLIGGAAAGLAGCFKKGWRTVLPVIGILFNLGSLVYFRLHA